MQVQFSADQYKQMTFDTIKDKFVPFVLGVGVMLLASSAIINRIPEDTLSQFIFDTKAYGSRLSNSFYAPKISKLNINNAIATSPTVAPTAVQPTAQPTNANIPPEEGQISAISSERVTLTEETYVVQEGDGLSDIAARAYGDGNMWTIIAEANNLASPDLLEVGMELKIPRR